MITGTYRPAPRHLTDKLTRQLAWYDQNVTPAIGAVRDMYHRLAVRSISRTLDDARALGYDLRPYIAPVEPAAWDKTRYPVRHIPLPPLDYGYAND